MHLFFTSWSELGRIVAVAIVLFILTVVLLRVVGQLALAKMSGYDVVFTVTLGSIVASVILTRSMSVADAAAALITLTALQEATRWLQARWLLAHHAVREAPRVVLWDGSLLEDRLRSMSVSADEVRAAIRRAGHAAIEDIQIVILENDGEWSVIAKTNASRGHSALHGLHIPDAERRAPSDRLP